MQRRFPRMLADARAYPHGYMVYAGVYRERRMRRICRLDLLPYRSEIVLAVVAGPQPLPSPERNREREAKNGAAVGRGTRKSGRRPYITAHEKRPSTGRLISEALPPAPFTGSTNPQPGHESRHSAASLCFPPLSHPSCPLQTYGHGARRWKASQQSSSSIASTSSHRKFRRNERRSSQRGRRHTVVLGHSVGRQGLLSRAPYQIISIVRRSNFHLDTLATVALSIHDIATNARSPFLRLICLLMLPQFSLFFLSRLVLRFHRLVASRLKSLVVGHSRSTRQHVKHNVA